MSFFDSAFDQMSFSEVSFRLPSEIAVRALQRRIINLDTLLSFFAICGNNSTGVPELKKHINTVLNSSSAKDILAKFEEKYHPTLFSWIDDANKARLKKDGASALNTKLLFNMTDGKDAEGLESILDSILAEKELKQASVLSVLQKAELQAFPQLA